jgi:hypothetical protein
VGPFPCPLDAHADATIAAMVVRSLERIVYLRLGSRAGQMA